MKHMKEYSSVLQQLGIKPTGSGRARYVRTKRVRIKAWAVIAGALVLTSVVWTVKYDGSSRSVISAERTEVHDNYTHGTRKYLAVVTILVGTGGVDTYNVPEKWNNADNYIEALGPGGSSGTSSGSVGGGAGGGGAYSKTDNVVLVPRGTANYRVGFGSTQNSTWLSNTGVAPTSTAEGVLAAAGSNASGTTRGLGGTTAASIGDTKFRGGNGSSGWSSGGGLFVFAASGAGGGAAGAGGRGGDGATNNHGGGGGGGTDGDGGDGSGTTGGTAGTGGGDGGDSGEVGQDGTAWEGTHGPGGGAGGTIGSGFQGGLYGGGSSGNVVTAGRNGLLVITYTPAVTQDDMMHWRPQPVNLKLHARAPRKRWLMQIPYRILKWRHLHFYSLIVTEPYEPGGPGQEDIRKVEPALSRIRTATLMRLRVINPSLEE
jgi:hypothetical protein